MVANPVSTEDVERLFLHWLPEIRSRAWAIHHHLPPDKREEAVAEATAWSWAWMLSGARRGTLERMTPRTMAIFASKMFRSGRWFAGGNSVHDVMSEAAQASGAVRLSSLDAHGAEESDTLEERGFAILRPLRTPKPPDIALCNLDYGLLLQSDSLSSRAKDVFRRLVTDHDKGCYTRIARELKVSPPLVSQIKGQLRVGPCGPLTTVLAHALPPDERTRHLHHPFPR